MLPNQIKIGGMKYQIHNVEGLYNKHDLLGHIQYLTGEIEIDNDLSEERKEQTLIHELMHGVFFEAGFQDQDEDVINRISLVLHQVLKDNDINFNDKKVFIDGIGLETHPNT